MGPRMTACPHCGAQNSVRRTECFQCQASLAATTTGPGPHMDRPRGWVSEPTAAAQPAVTPTPAARVRRITARPQGLLTRLPGAVGPLKRVRRSSTFFRQFHSLINAGIPIHQALMELSGRAPANYQRACDEMARAAAAGNPLSEAMARYPGLFLQWHVGLVRGAEAGGFLPQALDEIATALELEYEFRAAVLLQVFYYVFFLLPMILLVLPVAIILPHEPRDGWTAPGLIDAYLHTFATISVPIGLGLVAAYAALLLTSGLPAVQRVRQRIVFAIPLAGRIARLAALSRFTRLLGLLLGAGLPVGAAVEEAAAATGNRAFIDRLSRVARALREGTPLAAALAQARLFDADALRLTDTGQLTGDMPGALARIAGYYQTELETRLRIMPRVIQLLAFLVIGGTAVFLIITLFRIYVGYIDRAIQWIP